MSLAEESRQINAAANIALDENNVSRMHELIDKWKAAMAHAGRGQEEYTFGPFQDALRTAIEKDVDMVEMVKTLVQNGAVVDEISADNMVRRGQIPLLKAALEAGFDPNEENEVCGGDPLMAAVNINQLPVVKNLLDHGADPNRNLRFLRYKSIELAAWVAGSEIIDALIQNGAQLSGRQPLHMAARDGRISIIEHLLNCNVDINGIPKNDEVEGLCVGTALHEAAKMGQKESVIVLLKHGAEKNIRDVKGQTALDLAREKGYTEIVQLLQ